MNLRNLTGVPTLGNTLSVFLTGTLVVVAVVGCSNLDYRLMEACRIDQKTGEYEDYGSCQRTRETVSQEEEWRQRDEEAARAREYVYVEPSAEDQAAAAIKRQDANASASSKALASWNLEHQMAINENTANLQAYPDIAPYSGIWCWGGANEGERGGFERFEIIDDGRIRTFSFQRAYSYFPAKTLVLVYDVRRDGDEIVLTSQIYDWHRKPFNLLEESRYYHGSGTPSTYHMYRRCE